MSKDEINTVITNYSEQGGVYIHSVPSNTSFYDSMWMRPQPGSYFSLKQQSRLTKLLLPQTAKSIIGLHELRVLDVCAGHGGYSIAAVEMGAKNVYMCDGSFQTLHNFPKNLLEAPELRHDPSYYTEKITQVQADVDNIKSVFFKEKFDLVFQRYAIHHMRNPFETARQLATLVRPGGILSFNFFVTGCTPKIVRDFRRFFLTKDLKDVYDFLAPLGVVHSSLKEYEISDVLNDKISLDSRHDETINFLKGLTAIYSMNEISSRLHYEDLRTPYIHNIDFESFYKFVTENLGAKIIDGLRTVDEGSLTMLIPPGGIKNEICVPAPPDFSDEDISLGDEMIGLRNA